jgi:hypothetical protein
MKKALLGLALPLLAVCLVGCKDPYGACAKAGADIAQSVSSGFQTVTQLQQTNLISSQEALNVDGYLEFVNKADEAFLSCAQTAHTAGNVAGSFTACATTFNTTLNNPTELALLHVSNTTASQDVSVIANGVTTAVSAVIAALGGS